MSVLCRSRRELSNECFFRRSASIQPRTIPVKFARSAISIPDSGILYRLAAGSQRVVNLAFSRSHDEQRHVARDERRRCEGLLLSDAALLDRANITGLVLGSIEANFCK